MSPENPATLHFELPPRSSSLIDWLDENTHVIVTINDLGTEAGRLILASQLGKRELVDGLIMLRDKQTKGV